MNKPHSHNMYFAIIGDINYKYLSDISAKFIITLGDKFQGLLHDIFGQS